MFQHLSDIKLSPRLLATFEGGRIEEFIPDAVNLSGKGLELRSHKTLILLFSETEASLQLKVADLLGRFHKAAVPGEPSPVLFRRVEGWLAALTDIEWKDRKQQVHALNLPQIAKELALLKEKLTMLRSPVVFAHNDLLGANILCDKSETVYFIDFEYGDYNYRGFDIANHFCEYAGFQCDYSRFPNKVCFVLQS